MTGGEADALRACPFCDSKTFLHHGANGIGFVTCGQRDDGSDGCGAIVSFRPNHNGRAAVVAWNRRAALTRPAQAESAPSDAPVAGDAPVLWISPEDFRNRHFVGMNAVREGHEQHLKHYTMPLYRAAPKPAQGAAAGGDAWRPINTVPLIDGLAALIHVPSSDPLYPPNIGEASQYIINGESVWYWAGQSPHFGDSVDEMTGEPRHWMPMPHAPVGNQTERLPPAYGVSDDER